jgi:3-deoxy-D-manno-octulosonic-acid transferase
MQQSSAMTRSAAQPPCRIDCQLGEAGALRIGADADAVGEAIAALLDDDQARAGMVDAGLRLVKAGRGALVRTMELIAPDLPPAP